MTRRWKDSISQATKVLEMDPSNTSALYKRAKALMHRGNPHDLDSAERDLLEMQALVPSSQVAKSLLNVVQMKRNTDSNENRKDGKEGFAFVPGSCDCCPNPSAIFNEYTATFPMLSDDLN